MGSGLGLEVMVLGFRVSWFGVLGFMALGFGVYGLVLRDFKVLGLRFRVYVLGFFFFFCFMVLWLTNPNT